MCLLNEDLFCEEKMVGDNQYYCGNCGKKCDGIHR